MKIDAASQLAKIVGILGDQNPILRNGSGKHNTIRFAQPCPITGVDRVVQTVSVEVMAE